jgi:cytidylate kinase
MSVIVIVSDSSSNDREFARSLADRLGYSCVQPEVVIERAAARGFSQEEFRETLEKPPGVWQRFLHRPRIHLAMLRAALVEEIRPGNAICYGNLGLLLPRIEGLLRIRVDQSQETRCASVRERLKLPPAEATAWVRERDRDARRWRRWVCGPDYDGGLCSAFSVDLESVGVEEACDAIALIVRARTDDVGRRKQLAVLEDLALSSRVEVALALDQATAHLELGIQAESGSVWVQGRLRGVDELENVRRVVEKVEGVAELNGDEVRLSSDELAAFAALKPRTRAGNAEASLGLNPRLIWASMAAVLVLVIFYYAAVPRVSSTVSNALFHRVTVVGQTFTGIITDTKCAGSHAGMPEAASAGCVRRCVKTEPGVRFALHDGKAMYVLADQAGGDKFAGRRVAVIGTVDKETNTLTAKSIRSL